MNKYCTLAYVSDPFQIKAPILWLTHPDGSGAKISLAELGELADSIVTYQVPTLIDVFRDAGHKLPCCLVEVRDALKLISGLPKDEGGERQWDVFKRLRSIDPNIRIEKVSDILQGRSLRIDDDAIETILRSIGIALRQLWLEIIEELESHAERVRFFDVEVPMQQILWARQYYGIEILKDEGQRLIEQVRKEKYDAFRALAGILGRSPSGLTFQNVGNHLGSTDAAYLAEFSGSASFDGYFEIASAQSNFADLFLRFSKAKEEETVLARIDYSKERVFPLFSCCGTVTGRILVTDPRLQNLKKRHRSVIAPDSGKALLYLDYAQFEAGIVADFSADEELIKSYNSSDVYEQLALVVFGNKNSRDRAKKIFLAYCFGMPTHSIAKLLAGPMGTTEKTNTYGLEVAKFFERFPGLENLRQALARDLEERGHIGSLIGNRRIRKRSGPLTSKEKRWVMSQKVQGTASLIFKEALIALARRFGAASIILPMHDAVLMQYDLDKEDKEKVCKEASQIMEASFLQYCPSIKPRVVSSPFHKEG